jgi:hypothetical protein
MGRRKRAISPEGLLICKFDKENWHADHYTKFYGWDQGVLNYWYDPVEDIWIGRPTAWCMAHMKQYARTRYRPRAEATPEEKATFEEYLSDDLEVIKEQAGKMGPPVEHDPDWAWDDPRWQEYDKRGG